MKNRIMSFLAIAGCVAVMVPGIMLSSCSSSASKAGDERTFVLPDSLDIIGTELVGANPEVMAIGWDDAGYNVISYKLKENRTDTIFRNDEAWQPCQVAKTKTGYVVACRNDGGNPMYGYEYAVFLTGVDNKEGKMLKLDIDNENVTAMGYVINTDSETVELYSTEDDSENVTLYNVVYDFSGKQLADNSRNIPIKKVSKTSGAANLFNPFSGGDATYLWECSRCGEKMNATYKPDMGSGGRGCISHQWVKIQRVE